MERVAWRMGGLLSLVAAALVGVGGCTKEAPKADQGGTPKKVEKVVEKKEHDHSGWWCDEHGVPEAECSMCSGKVAAEFKKKGDWCEKHDRAKSQCFICDPSLKERYAAVYRAKYGKEPPEPKE
jgi:hypothetical protein